MLQGLLTTPKPGGTCRNFGGAGKCFSSESVKRSAAAACARGEQPQIKYDFTCEEIALWKQINGPQLAYYPVCEVQDLPVCDSSQLRERYPSLPPAVPLPAPVPPPPPPPQRAPESTAVTVVTAAPVTAAPVTESSYTGDIIEADIVEEDDRICISKTLAFVGAGAIGILGFATVAALISKR